MTGTELEARGLCLNGGGKLWSSRLLLDDPAIVQDVHLAYLRAGADVITTCTYQVWPHSIHIPALPGFRQTQTVCNGHAQGTQSERVRAISGL